MSSKSLCSMFRIFLSAGCGILYFLFQLERSVININHHSHPSHSRGTTKQNQPKLADGCYHVFLDVGSNIGMHVRFLFEPDLYPDSTSSVATFEKEFGSERDNRDYCVFSFEPNPKFEQRHLAIEKAYAEMGWRYTPIFAGASNRDGNLTFFHSNPNNPSENGFSAHGKKAGIQRIVPIIRLASWIQNEVEGRDIPKPHFNSGPPKVVMKLDIEGLEFRVFPDLITTGALCNNVHYLLGEFHHRNHGYMYPMNLTVDGQHALHHKMEGLQLEKEMFRLIDISDNCMTRYTLKDDESYTTDPHKLPSPTNQTLN